MSRNITSQNGGIVRITTTNADHLSHGGTKDKDFKNGEQVKEVHNTPDGRSHEHAVRHGLFGPSAGTIKQK